MERIAIVDFFDDRGSIALRHTGTDPDAIYADIADAFEAEGFDTITLFTPEEAAESFTSWDPKTVMTLIQLS